jgi:hypothetical protein
MVKPTTSGDEAEGFVEWFSASKAAAVELSTPPLIATTMLISVDTPQLPIVDC